MSTLNSTKIVVTAFLLLGSTAKITAQKHKCEDSKGHDKCVGEWDKLCHKCDNICDDINDQCYTTWCSTTNPPPLDFAQGLEPSNVCDDMDNYNRCVQEWEESCDLCDANCDNYEPKCYEKYCGYGLKDDGERCKKDWECQSRYCNMEKGKSGKKGGEGPSGKGGKGKGKGSSDEKNRGRCETRDQGCKQPKDHDDCVEEWDNLCHKCDDMCHDVRGACYAEWCSTNTPPPLYSADLLGDACKNRDNYDRCEKEWAESCKGCRKNCDHLEDKCRDKYC